VTGSGLDIVTFSLLVLTWRLNEKIATPTTVILMGCNALVGFAWRLLGPGEPIPAEAWTYLQVCIPVVVIGAPVGTWLAARSPRLLVVAILCASILVQFEAALLIIPLDPERILVICGSLAMGLSVFGMMAWAGRGSAARPPGTEREAS